MTENKVNVPKKWLLTGGCGFIGSAVCRYGVGRGINILNVDSMSYAANEANLNAVKGNSNYAFEKLDIRDLEKESQKIVNQSQNPKI